jgi:hypothetical protein
MINDRGVGHAIRTPDALQRVRAPIMLLAHSCDDPVENGRFVSRLRTLVGKLRISRGLDG